MKKLYKIATLFFIIFAVLKITFVNAETEVTRTNDGVMWSSGDNSIKIFLIGNSYRATALKVIANDDLKIIYHTRINSTEDIIKELEPNNTTQNEVKNYTLTHSFTRTTIWMAIEVQKDGKRIDGLTRTFYGSIYETVDDRYWQ